MDDRKSFLHKQAEQLLSLYRNGIPYRNYPCGCLAYGPTLPPDYCPEHGIPITISAREVKHG